MKTLIGVNDPDVGNTKERGLTAGDRLVADTDNLKRKAP